jgi:hypothetical protein
MRSAISKIAATGFTVAWSIATIPPALAQDTCRQGFVWREAFVGDHVCVTPRTRDQAARENSEADARRQPGGGAYGPAPSSDDERAIDQMAFNPGHGFDPLGITHARVDVYATSARNRADRGLLSTEAARAFLADRS